MPPPNRAIRKPNHNYQLYRAICIDLNAPVSVFWCFSCAMSVSADSTVPSSTGRKAAETNVAPEGANLTYSSQKARQIDANDSSKPPTQQTSVDSWCKILVSKIFDGNLQGLNRVALIISHLEPSRRASDSGTTGNCLVPNFIFSPP